MTRVPPGLVLMAGPDLRMHGGIASVERSIVAGLSDRLDIRHIPSVSDAGWLRRIVGFANAIRCLRRDLRRRIPLVVHIHFASGGSTIRKLLLAKVVLRSRRPLILHAHGGGFREYFRRLPVPVRRSVARTLARADRLIVLSREWKDFYVDACGVTAARVCVLPNAVDVPEHVPDRTGRPTVQILYLGRISRAKGAFDLLRAFESLPPSCRDRARLVIAGDGDVAALRGAARKIEADVRIHSWLDVSERNRLLAESDIFALPSYSEGLPLALLESMAAGLAVIATPVGGIPSVVTDGDEAYLIAPGDLGALVGRLSELIDNEPLRHSMGARARERSRNYDLDDYLRRLELIYCELLNAADDRYVSQRDRGADQPAGLFHR